MSEPRAVNPALAARPDRPVAGSAADAVTLPPESARSARSAGSTESTESAESAEVARSSHADPSDPVDPADLADRERWLFRHVSRAGQVHPLRHLLKRYRAGERA